MRSHGILRAFSILPLLAASLVACAAEPERKDVGVTSAATLTTAATSASGASESTSSGADEPAAYGPCAADEDCEPVLGMNGELPQLTECVNGRCTYACGDGWGGPLICPDYLDGFGATCGTGHRCKATDCSEDVVNGRCCADWCGGECYAPPSVDAVCECGGPSLGCPCETWCEGDCVNQPVVGEVCYCFDDSGCPAGTACVGADPENQSHPWGSCH